MRSLMFACMMLSAPVPALAATNDEILAKAQTAFRHGVENRDKLIQARRDFAEATDAYLQLHQNGVRSPALYRNLGDAAYLADRWTEAIWAYHMGLRLDPNDQIMREHLIDARKKILYPAAGQGRPDADAWPNWLYRPTSGEWFTAVAVANALAWIAGVLAFMRLSNRFLIPAFAAAALAIGAAAGLWSELEKTRFEQDTPLVVVAVNTPYHRGNGPSYPQHASVPILPRGIEARLVHRRGDWLQIRLSSGEIGWVPRNRVLIVEP
jgi:hypothetical protein